MEVDSCTIVKNCIEVKHEVEVTLTEHMNLCGGKRSGTFLQQDSLLGLGWLSFQGCHAPMHDLPNLNSYCFVLRDVPV